MISILPESWFPMSGMVVSLLRNSGSHSPEVWLSKSGQVAQRALEYSSSMGIGTIACSTTSFCTASRMLYGPGSCGSNNSLL